MRLPLALLVTVSAYSCAGLRDHALPDKFSPTSDAPIVLPDGTLPNGSPIVYAASPGVSWAHLNWDASNFFCTSYASLCNDVLDQVACPPRNRAVWACGNPFNTSVPATLDHYNATCTCSDPFVPPDYTTARLTELLFDNRAKPAVSWHLLPWQSTKYDIAASYAAFCLTALQRLGCPVTPVINATGNSTASWTCACGAFTTGSKRAYVDIVDKLADLSLQQLPVFREPLYLSIQLSIALLVIVGKLGSMLATAVRLPAIIGFLLVGMGMQDIVSRGLIKGASTLGAKFFSEMRVLALVVVLMRAGLTLSPRALISKGAMTVMLSVTPYFCEFGAMFGSASLS